MQARKNVARLVVDIAATTAHHDDPSDAQADDEVIAVQKGGRHLL